MASFQIAQQSLADMKGRLAPSKLAKTLLADINLLKHSGFPGYRRLPAKICD